MSAKSCPCEFVEPCAETCSCACPFMSAGCSRCCKYGSAEQQKAAAVFLKGKEDRLHELEKAIIELKSLLGDALDGWSSCDSRAMADKYEDTSGILEDPEIERIRKKAGL